MYEQGTKGKELRSIRVTTGDMEFTGPTSNIYMVRFNSKNWHVSTHGDMRRREKSESPTSIGRAKLIWSCRKTWRKPICVPLVVGDKDLQGETKR